jgi:hypothetical protein
MNKIITLFFTFFFSVIAVQSWAQLTTPASARQTTASSGRPSAIAIKRNILQIQQAQIQAELKVVQQCIKDARLPQTLRDPQGNVNIVPQTDLINCSRQLRTLTRQLNTIASKTRQLGQDATASALYLERRARQAEFLRRTGLSNR